MANESVRIPVELELSSMQKTLTQMKGMLKELKPGTEIYDELSKSIKKIDNDLISLTNRSKKAFSSQSEITSFAKSFDKVGLSMQDVLEKFQRIDFKDLQIDEASPDGQAWKNANKEISETINKIKKLQSSVLTNTDIIKPETIETLKSLDASFDETKTSVEDCFTTLNKEINSTNKELKTAQDNVEKLTRTYNDLENKTQTKENDLNKAKGERDVFEASIRSFEKSKGNKNFEQAKDAAKLVGIKTMSDADFKKLSPEKKIEQINEYYKRIEEAIEAKRLELQQKIDVAEDAFNTAFNKQADADANLQAEKQKVAGLEIKRDGLTQAKENLGASQSAANQEIATLQKEVERLNKVITELENKLLKASKAMQHAGAASEQTGKDVESANKDIAASTETLKETTEATKSLENIKHAVGHWFTFGEVISKVKSLVGNAVRSIKELDSVMTEIAVVTDMSQKDLWNQIGTYSAVAQQYGVSTKGAYEVSMLWYQQGLQGAEVMDLTIETLKMAKIAGLDYATATDYMTVAIRGFKLEMEDAQNVTDVYSALAAATASSTEEIAVAMSKTASSAEAVGSSFESTSAMIATMISVTREAPENIGSALKSIISRYGEMTSDPTKMVDAEGEAMSLNKVDKALQSVGISLQDAKGQFRDFDEVILELAESWDTIDTNTQRYIATVMAGNRQQSRFLALVGNVDEYKKALSTAEDSEGAGTIQYLKTMDSIESKIQQVKTAWEQFYSSMGIEGLFKGVLDVITKILTNLNKMGKGSALLSVINIFLTLKKLVKLVFGDITTSISKVFNKFKNEKLSIKADGKEAESWLDRLLARIKKGATLPVKVQEVSSTTNEQTGNTIPVSTQKAAGADALESYRNWAVLNSDKADISQEDNLASFAGVRRMQLGWVKDGDNTAIEAQVNMEIEALKRAIKECGSSFQNAEQYADDLARSLDNLDNEVDEEGRKKKRKNKKEKTPEEKAKTAAAIQTGAQIAQMLGAVISTWALTIEDSSEHSIERSKVASGFGQALSGAGSGALMGLQVAGPWGALVGGILGALTGLPAILDGLNKTTEEQIALLKQEHTELKNAATQRKGEYISLKTEIDSLKELEEAQYESDEAMQAYKDKMNELADKYPELISAYDESGNAVIEARDAELALAEARMASSAATVEALEKEYEILKTKEDNLDTTERGKISGTVNTSPAVGDYYVTEENRENFDEAGVAAVTRWMEDKDITFFNADNIEDYYKILSEEGQGALQWKLAQDLYYQEQAKELEAGNIDFIQDFEQLNQAQRFSYFDNAGRLAETFGEGLDAVVEDGKPSYVTQADEYMIEAGLVPKNSINLVDIDEETFKRNFNDIVPNGGKNTELYDMLEAYALAAYADSDLTTEQKFEKLTGSSITEYQALAGAGDVQGVWTIFNTARKNYDREMARNDKKLESVGERLIRADFEADLDSLYYDSLQDGTKNTIEENKEFLSNLGTLMLKPLLENRPDYKNLADWRADKDSDYQAQQELVMNTLSDLVQGEWSRKQIDNLESIFNNLSNFKTEADLEQELIDLGVGPEIREAFLTGYRETLAETRERFEKAVVSYSGAIDLSGFNYLFDESGDIEIISSYANELIDIMQEIDDYARDGYTHKAGLLKSAAVYFYRELGSLSGEDQSALSNIVSRIDWNDQSSILSAAKEIEKYGLENDINLDGVIKSLKEAAETLSFNIATRVQNYVNTLSANAEKTGELIEKASDGLDFSEAVEAFDALSATNEDLRFDDIFVFDKELGKYIYTVNGLNLAFEKQNEDLAISRQVYKDAINDFNNLDISIDDTGSVNFGEVEISDIGLFVENGKLTDEFYDKFRGYSAEDIAQLEQLFLNYDPTSDLTFSEYIEDYYSNLVQDFENADQMYLAWLQEKRNSWLEGLDIENLAAGVLPDGQNAMLEEAIRDIVMSQGYNPDKIISTKYTDYGKEVYTLTDYYMEQITSGNLAAMEEIFGELSYEDKTSYLSGRVSAFSTAMDELFSAPGTILSETTINLLKTIEGGEALLDDSGVALKEGAEGLLDVAIELYKNIVDSYTQGYADLESVNAMAVNIINQVLGTEQDSAFMSSLGGSDIGIDTLTTLANSFGFLLSDIINLETGAAISLLEGLLVYDPTTQTYNITDFKAFVRAIEAITGEQIDRTSDAYLEMYSNFVDDKIGDKTVKGDKVIDEIDALKDVQIGDYVNLTYLTDAIGAGMGDLVEYFGFEIEDGLLKVTEDTDLVEFFNYLSNSEELKAALGESFAEVQDGILSVIESWGDMIVDGLSGELSFADANILKGQLGLEDADFSETREGLKLTYEGAAKLYDKLNQFDGIPRAKILESLAKGYADIGSPLGTGVGAYSELERIEADIKELTDREKDLNDQEKERLKLLRQEKALVQDILAVRSTEASYNFMDQELPEYLQGPMSLWEGAAAASEAIANNGGSLTSGKIGFADYTNLINTMEDFGVEYYITSKTTGERINAGADLLNEAYKYMTFVDGEAVIDLSEFSQDFIIGGDEAKAGLTTGINELASMQIEMLDAAIAFLETIVAFESLQNIDGFEDGIINDGDIYESVGGLTHLTEGFKGWLAEIVGNEGLMDTLSKIQIGNYNLASIFQGLFDGQDDVNKALAEYGLSQEQFEALVQGFLNASLNGDFDPETFVSFLPEELQELFAGSGLTFTVGEQVITFASDGAVYTFENEEDKIEAENFLMHTFGREDNDYSVDWQEMTSSEKVFVENKENIELVEEDGKVVTYKYTKDGKTIDLGTSDENQAAAAIQAINAGDLSNITEVIYGEDNTVTAQGVKNLGNTEINIESEVTLNDEGEVVKSQVEIVDPITGRRGVGETQEEALKDLAENNVGAFVGGKRIETLGESYTYLNLPVEITLTEGGLTTLTPSQMQEVVNAAYSGNTDEAIQLMANYKVLPEGTDVSELTPAQKDQILKDAGLNIVPMNMTISFGTMTPETAEEYSTAFESIVGSLNAISTIDLTTTTDEMNNLVVETTTGIQGIADMLQALTEAGYEIDLTFNVTSNEGEETSYNFGINDSGATTTLADLAYALFLVNMHASTFVDTLSGVQTRYIEMGDLADAIKKLEDKSEEVGDTAEAISLLKDKSRPVKNTAAAINGLSSKTITATITTKLIANGSSIKLNTELKNSGGQKVTGSSNYNTGYHAVSEAKGNVALSKGTGGTALAGGSHKTLMGELGPELVVSGGRYFTVGNNGAEFVDLPSDAIVFNHLQTKKLLSKGHSGTGKPVTNEKNATSMAAGNASGPAMASASETLSELKKLRAMWQSLAEMSAQEFAGLGGGGKGGGGGGGGGSGDKEDLTGYLHDLEQWYNWLRQIAKLEQQITYEQAKRENMRNGYDYAASLNKEIRLLEKQRDINKELAEQQRSFYNDRREDLNASEYSRFFTYDEDGLMQYREGAYENLAKMQETDVNGKVKMTSKEQLEYLKGLGFDTSVLDFKSDGSKAETDDDKMAVFWENFDGWIEELDSLFDSSNEYATAAEEAATAIQEALQEYIDIQLSAEEKIMQAIVDREEKEIERMEKELEAYEKASQEYISGLSDALNRERQLYSKNEKDTETAKLQRQLAILQRSGGSASQIRSLQEQIDSRLRDSYFEEQQSQIDAIQEASNNQIEKLQEQIDIANETLEYQKEHGLLWEEVSEIMRRSPEEVAQFIAEHSREYESSSSLQREVLTDEIIKEIQILQGRDRENDWEKFFGSVNQYDEDFKKKHAEGARKAYMDALDAGKSTTEAEGAALAYLKTKNEETPKKEEDKTGGGPSTGTGTGTETGTGNGKVKTSTGERLNVRSKPNTDSSILGKLNNGASVKLTGKNSKWYKIDYNGKTGYVWANSIQTSDKDKLPKFAKGGLVDFTGPAWVDGTKSKPEAFLSADDTAMLKSKIFSNSDGSLKSLVTALEAITGNTVKYSGSEGGEQINIQTLQVNIQPGTISSDYDARRAGEKAMEEMVRIARKTTNRIVSK